VFIYLISSNFVKKPLCGVRSTENLQTNSKEDEKI